MGIGSLVVWIVCCALYAPNGWMDYRQKIAEFQRLQQENQQIEKENEALMRRITALKSNPRVIEKIAREELGCVRPGDYIYRIPSSRPALSAAPRLSANARKESSANAVNRSSLSSLPVKPSSKTEPLRIYPFQGLEVLLAAVVVLSVLWLLRSVNPTQRPLRRTTAEIDRGAPR